MWNRFSLCGIDAEVLWVSKNEHGGDALIPEDAMQTVGIRPRQRLIVTAEVYRWPAINAEHASDVQNFFVERPEDVMRVAKEGRLVANLLG